MKLRARFCNCLRVASVLAGALAVTPASPAATLSTPMDYCFWQSEWRDSLDVRALSFVYHALIAESDYSKEGDVFFAFQQSKAPNSIWFLQADGWKAYTPGTAPLPYLSGQLAPIVPIRTDIRPADLTGLDGNGEFWVGYGLRSTSLATVADSYQEMLDSKRSALLWRIGEGYRNLPGLNSWICLKVTGLTASPASVVPTAK